MGAQDNTEKVLRSLHVMLSQSDAYEFDTTKVVVDRQAMVDLLTELNRCIYEMMDEYELTRESRDQAERAFQKHGDEIIWDASRKAEDVYAASVMYTDEALSSVQDIIASAADSMKMIYDQIDARLKEEQYLIRSNQTELKAQLQDLVDAEKYLKLIEERNWEIMKEKTHQKEKTVRKKEPSIYANRQTEIRVNTEVLEKMGLSMDADEGAQEEEAEVPTVRVEIPVPAQSAKRNIATPDAKEEEDSEMEDLIRLDLDADYFKWKEEQDAAIEGGHSKKEQKDLSEGIQKVLKSLTGGKR